MKVDRKEYDRQWRAKNPDKVVAKRERYRQLHREEQLQYFRDRTKKMPSTSHGLTKDEVAEWFTEQGKKCAICHRTNPGKAQWHGDHDHKTGRFRGVLCGPCNMALGLFKDDIVRIIRAAGYLAEIK